MLKLKEAVVQPIKTPKVGVVVLNWNSYEFTRDCLKSLYELHYDNWLPIVVDNGSFDSSADRLEEDFCGLNILRLCDNRGYVGGNNYGIKVALSHNCSYILLLNNDTIVDCDLLAEMVKVASSNPLCGIVTPKIYYFQEPKTIQSAGSLFSLWTGIALMKGRKALDCGQFDKIVEVPYASGCALLVKTDVVNEIGLLDEDFFAYAEDIDWSLRAKKAGYSILYAPIGRVWHKEYLAWREKRNQSLRFYLSVRNGLWLIRKHGKWFHWFVILPSYMIRWVGKFVLLSLLRSDNTSAWAALRGLAGFIRMATRPTGWQEKEKQVILKYATQNNAGIS